jgi:hypothetical protein
MDKRYSGGMLGNLFTAGDNAQRAEEREDQMGLERLSAMDGFQADRLATYQGADMAGKGIGQLAAVAAGKDPRSPAVRNAQAIEAAKAQVAQLGFDPDDPKSMDTFYKQVIEILRKQGLVAEAMAVAGEWNTKKQGDAKTAAEQEKLRLENEKLLRQKNKDDNDYDLGLARIEALKAKGLGAAASPIGKMMRDMDNATDPVMRAHLKRAIENASAGKVIVQDLGDRVQLLDATTREPIRTDEKGLAPRDVAKSDKADEKDKFAYAEIKADMQRQVDKAAELHNHAGLNGMTGPLGRLVGKDSGVGEIATTLARGPTRAAHAVYVSVIGGTLLTGLAKLKRESPTGASGLGALSEQEGNKVQADAAALGQHQDAADLRVRLREYINNIMQAGARLDGKAQATGVTVIPLHQPALTGPRGKVAVTPEAPSTPATAAPAAPANGRIRIRLPDGRTGTTTAADLPRAKAAGAVEIP